MEYFFNTYFNFTKFFFPLKIFFIYIILIGLVFFLYLVFKKKLNINIFIFSIILFFLIFINYENGHNIDSPVYHTQTIRWAYDKKLFLVFQI